MSFNKIAFLVLINFFYLTGWSQIIITEVHADTPYEEDLRVERDYKHHQIGEYIELYNYSNKDISLKGWALTDYVGKFSFPDDAVIKSGDFLIVAYRSEELIDRIGQNIPGLPSNNYFSSIFPNTVGQEEKIIYQDAIILRNLIETIRLHVGYINSTYCNNFKIQDKVFEDPFFEFLYSEEATNNPLTFDFYNSGSFNLQADGTYIVSTPTPLESAYLPPIQDLETIPSVLDALYTNYNAITWEEYSNEILFATCPLVITEIEQNPIDTFQDEGLCFNYDVSGNMTSAVACEPDDENPVSNSEYSASELEEIDSKIVLYPNPTYSILNVSWDVTVNGKLTEMQVSNSNGTSIYTTIILPTDSGTSVDLSYYPSGIYIVKFELDSGQFISRNVIKL